MASSYPGSLDSLTNPAGTDHQDTVLHSTQHANANDAIEAIQGVLAANPHIDAYGTNWTTVKARLNAIDGAWADWTPTLTGSTSNPSLGTGGVTWGRYKKIGKLVVAFGGFKFGTSASGGSGTFTVSLPANAAYSGVTAGLSMQSIGHAVYGRAGSSAAGDLVGGNAYVVSGGTSANLTVDGWAAVTSLLLSESNPWAWGSANDSLQFWFLYEAA